MNVLEKIFSRKRDEVANAKLRISEAEIESLAARADSTRGFCRALKATNRDLALIAEVKKASPSKGVIRENFDPAAIALEYSSAGADCLSVLTDEHYFQGSLENLKLARNSSGLPCLRKDFIYDPYQVYEARAWGADAILLIVAGLADEELARLSALATQLGMDVLVEVHNQSETRRALELKSPLIGVNNRDLADFRTSLEISDTLMPLISPYALGVSESALETRADLDRVKRAGASAVLIGTTFCRDENISATVHRVMGDK